jgi:hypothetical protein
MQGTPTSRKSGSNARYRPINFKCACRFERHGLAPHAQKRTWWGPPQTRRSSLCRLLGCTAISACSRRAASRGEGEPIRSSYSARSARPSAINHATRFSDLMRLRSYMFDTFILGQPQTLIESTSRNRCVREDKRAALTPDLTPVAETQQPHD